MAVNGSRGIGQKQTMLKRSPSLSTREICDECGAPAALAETLSPDYLIGVIVPSDLPFHFALPLPC